jgi:methionyl-tRNA formyltransferase
MKIGVISNNDFCLPLLFFLAKNKAETNLYLGNSMVVDGKRDEVQRFCGNYHIPFSDQMSTGESVYEWMDKSKPEVVFMIGHLEKIDLKEVKPDQPLYNIHFGRLPQYRGASPLFWQLKKMDPTVGCCIHALSDTMDAGPVIWEKEIRNEDHFTHSYLQYLFSNFIVEGVNDILSNPINHSLKIQDEANAHWYPKPALKDVLIRWDSMPAIEICALVRACTNWNAGAITLYQGMEAKIIDINYQPSSLPGMPPGTITAITDSIKVSGINNQELSIYYLSLNGIPFPGREASKFGVMIGERLTYPSD